MRTEPHVTRVRECDDVATPLREEDFTLDPTGNWSGYLQKTSGSTQLNQSRTHNPVNEVTDITETVGPAWATPAHDLAGNMTTVPDPLGLTAGLTLKYDAWNRLVEVKDGTEVLAQYEYDGLNRRVLKRVPVTGQGSASGGGPEYETDYYFHNVGWQVLETRRTDQSSASPDNLQPRYQYVWSNRYIDSPILRDKNTDQDNLCDDERFYYLTDANFNVTSLIDTNGDALERYLYDPYGKVTIYDGTWTNTRSSSSYDNTVLYTGREYDPETGFYHYRRRPYTVDLARLFTRDPIRYRGGRRNLYLYAEGNPESMVDPMGKFGIIPGALGGGAVGQFCICLRHRRSWDREFGARDATQTEKDCLNTAMKYMNWRLKQAVVTRCVVFNLAMADNVQKPTTRCKVLCHMPPFNRGAKTYLGAKDVNCRNCFNTLNTIMTLIHECYHHRLNCPGESETYQVAIGLFEQVRANCERMVADGVCDTVQECRNAIDEIVAADRQELQGLQ